MILNLTTKNKLTMMLTGKRDKQQMIRKWIRCKVRAHVAQVSKYFELKKQKCSAFQLDSITAMHYNGRVDALG